MATYYHILVWEIAWTEDPGRLQSMGVEKESDDLVTKQHQVLFHMAIKSVSKHGLRSKVSNLNEKRKILPFEKNQAFSQTSFFFNLKINLQNYLSSPCLLKKKFQKKDNNKLILHYLEIVTVNCICVYPIYSQYVYIHTL